MKNAVQKWGNSLGLRIPAAIASQLRIKRGTPVTLQLEDDSLIVRVARPKRKRRRHNLTKLLGQITPRNLPPMVDWGKDVGEEVL